MINYITLEEYLEANDYSVEDDLDDIKSVLDSENIYPDKLLFHQYEIEIYDIKTLEKYF